MTTTDVASAAPSSSPQLVLLENALSSWSTFDLTDRRPHLDDTAQSLLDGKESSAVARKRLGEATKNLKAALKNVEKLDVHNGGDTGGASTAQNTTTTKLTAECKSTIRMYQEEIDAVTRRAKFAENAFVQLYGGLSPLPDPAYILRDARRALHGQEGQIDNLLRGMEELTVQLDDANDDRSRLTRTVKEMNDRLGAAAVAAATTTAAQLQQQKRGGKEGVDGGDSSLTNAEKRELIQLRKEVAEFELEFRGLKNQDITIRKLESEYTMCYLLFIIRNLTGALCGCLSLLGSLFCVIVNENEGGEGGGTINLCQHSL
jgi:homeobox protein cut-like